MKHLQSLALLILVLLASLQPLRADNEVASDTSSADTDWAELKEALAIPSAEQAPKALIEYYKLKEARALKIQQLGLSFFEKYPADPRRWSALLSVLIAEPSFFSDYKPEFDKKPTAANAVIDETAKAAWEERRKRLLVAAETAANATEDIREYVAVVRLQEEYATLSPVQKASLLPRIASLAALYPNGRQLPYFVYTLYSKLLKTDPESVRKLTTDLLSSPHKTLRDFAVGQQSLIDGKKTPVKISFVAMDGREVSLEALRGKVVLIDFWATWCGPCVEELPLVKNVYDKYHDKGFEVIGISLDGPKAQDSIVSLLKKHGITWPQCYDGKGPKTPLALQFAVTAIPDTLLIDQNGLIVASKLRGPALEMEVGRLLDK